MANRSNYKFFKWIQKQGHAQVKIVIVSALSDQNSTMPCDGFLIVLVSWPMTLPVIQLVPTVHSTIVIDIREWECWGGVVDYSPTHLLQDERTCIAAAYTAQS